MAHQLFPIVLIGAITITIALILLARIIKKGVNYSRTISVIMIVYGTLATEILILVFSLIHFHSIQQIHFHLMLLINGDETTNFYEQIPILHVLLVVVILTISIFLLSFIISQISLRILSNKYKLHNLEELSLDLISKLNINLSDKRICIIPDRNIDAFSFTLLKYNSRIKFYTEDWIVITTKMIDLLEEEELEMVFFHEYAHIYEKDTRYTHLIFTVSSLIFFDPILRFFKRIIHEKHEIEADRIAITLMNRPRTLANALFKILEIGTKQSRIYPGFFSNRKNLMVKRIEILLKMEREILN